MRITAVTLMLIALASGASAQSRESAPRLRLGTDYDRARQILMDQGYWPEPQHPTVPCEAGDQRCDGYPEMAFCSPTGVALCSFIWRSRRGAIIEVQTVGEGVPGVERVRCRLGCH